MTAALVQSNCVETSVFSWLRNVETVSEATLVSIGSVFQREGPATEKLPGPKPTVLVLGTTTSPIPAERR